MPLSWSVTALTLRPLTWTWSRYCGAVATTVGTRSMRGPAARESGATVSLVTTRSALARSCDRAVDRVLEARGEDGDEDHEREADHQRRRRDRGARRVARGVVARELAGRVPEALQRPADDGRQRAHDVARAQRDADEHEQRAEPHRGDPAAGRAASEQALDQEREPGEAHQRR